MISTLSIVSIAMVIALIRAAGARAEKARRQQWREDAAALQRDKENLK